MNKHLGRVLVFGANGMVGSSICRVFEEMRVCSELVRATRQDVDLRREEQTLDFIRKNQPTWVVLAAAKVGGIYANNHYPRDFIYENLRIQLNVIEACYKANVEHLLFLGSSCIYPKFTSQPIEESELLSGALEETNEAYAIAKIAGIKLCESYNRQYGTDFRSVMPTNLYGPKDNYHPLNSHVVPALIDRFHRSKVAGLTRVEVWGTGKPKRDFLHVDDLARACAIIMASDKAEIAKIAPSRNSHINVGSGSEVSIADLASRIKTSVGYKGSIKYDSSQPDGTPAKRLDLTRVETLGWKPRIDLDTGINLTYQSYLDELNGTR